jgi:hypothetical protein
MTNANATSTHAPNARVCRGRAREIIGSTASKDRKEASAEAGQPSHGHSVHFDHVPCHTTARAGVV